MLVVMPIPQSLKPDTMRTVLHASIFFVLLFSSTYGFGQTDPIDSFPIDEKTGLHYLPNQLVVNFINQRKPKQIVATQGIVKTNNKALDLILGQFRVNQMTPLMSVDSIFVIKCADCDVRQLKEKLQTITSTRFVEYNYITDLNTTCPGGVPTVNDHYKNQSLLEQINIGCTWDITTGQNAVVGLVDATGNGLNHVDLVNRVISNINLTGTTNTEHGHNMGGLIAAKTDNSYGMPSITYYGQMRTYNIALYNTGGSISSSAAIDGVTRATNDHVDVINMSFTWSNSGSMKQAVDYAITKGIAVVTASGNYSYISGCDNPGVICVTSVDGNDVFSTTGNQAGSGVDLSAPDQGYWSLGSGNTMRQMSRGTSQSAALVSGTVALMYSISPYMTPAKARNFLKCAADNISNVGDNSNYDLGEGRLNVYKAVQQAQIDASLLSGPTTVCSNQYYTYSVPSFPGVTYRWVTSSGASIQSGQGTRSVSVLTSNTFSSFSVQCIISTGRCSQTKTKVSSNCAGGGWLVSAYPNPTSEDLNVEMQRTTDETTDDYSSLIVEDLPETTFSLFDQFGQKVRSIRGRGKATLDIRSLKKGFYTLRVTYDEEVITKRIEVL